MTRPGSTARQAAFRLLSGVLDSQRSLAEQLADETGPLAALEPPDRARAQSLATMTLRHLGRIDAFLDGFVRKRPARPAMHALRLATAETHIAGTPAHAAVDAAVHLAKGHPKARNLSGFVNAVARKAAAASGAWEDTPESGLPDWLAARLEDSYGSEAAARIAGAHFAEPPLDLTPKQSGDAENLARELGGRLLPTGSIRLSSYGQVSRLPGYGQGRWWVQDAAAALPARLLGNVTGLRVLDLCAAPGGKTLQLAAAGAHVTALDLSEPRLRRLRQNLERTGLDARIVTADALQWTPPEGFDAILLDAPCSATGTIRRHPDLPHVRRQEDVASLAALQARLLARAWDWLAPGGHLVYCTCSLLPEEGGDIVARFLENTPDALRKPAAPPGGSDPDWTDPAGALRLRPDFWPETGGMDGFYAALLQKQPPSSVTTAPKES